ncbi:hypothetical protein [Flavobacterium sp. N2270]|uniref:hypothetical protein n=1 Tax=Flavobacterium sp. N2270 TaxID=2986831 RepID=UPI0022255B95|nr:hypothetical protein [Flavobacterium sp. N2270]
MNIKLLILLFGLSSISLFSQNKIIEGKIFDENFQFLENAFIETTDGKYYTKSNENGDFKIIIPSEYNELKVQFVGLHPYVIHLENRCFINVILLNHFLIEFKTLKEEDKFYSKRRKRVNRKFKNILKNNKYRKDSYCLSAN